MINFSDFCIADAVKDDAVGISIGALIQGGSIDAYATVIEEGNKVGCHSHHKGEEWYIILAGEGTVFTSDVENGALQKVTGTPFSSGSIFRISAGTAHQLRADKQVKLIFLCPPSHLAQDRTVFSDLC
jgi:mannose-6-phosphate isomerase-like protein (cupin superfamily)